MKLIVDIPYETYKDYMTDRIKTTEVLQAVRHGQPLPKHHGRLGDLDEFIEHAKQAVTMDLLEEIKENISYEVDTECIAPIITASIFIGKK